MGRPVRSRRDDVIREQAGAGGADNACDGRLDLVRLAIELVGTLQLSDVLDRSLRVLGESLPGSSWAILNLVGPLRYRATLRGSPALGDLRMLARLACGESVWLCLEQPVKPGQSLRLPAFGVSPRELSPLGKGPDVLLGCWPANAGHPSIDARDLQTAAGMVASAIAMTEIFDNLLQQSSRDPLTKLLNRRGILDAVQRETARARRNARPLSILFLDVDGFKSINDVHGHSVGDELLTALSERLSATLRKSDAVGRFGGDEFLVVLPDADLKTAHRIGRRLSDRVGRAPFLTTRGSLRVGLSFGAALAGERGTAGELIEIADRRMLARKKSSAARRDRRTLPAAHAGLGGR